MIIDNLRSFRVSGMAVFDWVGTILITLLIINKFHLNTFKTVILIIPLIVFFHKLFKVNSIVSSLFDNSLWMKLFVQSSIIYYLFL